MVLDECANADASTYWHMTGVSMFSDPAGSVFGFRASAVDPTNVGPVARVPIDVDGTGLGWYATERRRSRCVPGCDRSGGPGPGRCQ